jgi:hypothetical protein
MIVLVTDKETAQSLNGKYDNDCYLQFIQTNQGWIVGANILSDKNFEAIHKQLKKLKQIEYVENEQAY